MGHLNEQTSTDTAPRTPLCATISGTRASTYRFAEPFVCRDNSPVFVRAIDSVLVRHSSQLLDRRYGRGVEKQRLARRRAARPKARATVAHEKQFREAVGTIQKQLRRAITTIQIAQLPPPQSDKQGEKLLPNSRTICVIESPVFK